MIELGNRSNSYPDYSLFFYFISTDNIVKALQIRGLTFYSKSVVIVDKFFKTGTVSYTSFYSVMPKGQGTKLVLHQNLPFKNIHIWPWLD